MGWLKQLCLSWTILFAVCVSCQELRSTLREGNLTCPGEEIVFTCTIRGSSSLSVLVLEWSSTEYIGQGRSLQLSTANMLGHVETSTSMDRSITATATVTNSTNVDGVLVLKSTLRITAVEPSVVTCSGTSGGTESIEFSISAVPGIPQRISAGEISRPVDNICIILVTWDPPANSDASDIDQYIVYVPSRNITMNIPSSSILTTLTVPNCGDDIHVQVAAVSRAGCVGMNSSDVQVTLLNIPTVPTEDGSSTTGGGSFPTEGGSISISSTSSVTAAASVAAVLFIILCFVLVLGLVLFGVLYKRVKKIKDAGQVLPGDVLVEHAEAETNLIDNLQNRVQDYTFVKRNVEELYSALKLKLPSRNMQSAARELRKTLMLGKESAKFNENVKEAFISCLEKVQSEKGEDVKRAIENMDNILTGMTGIDEEFKRSVRLVRKHVGTDEHQKVLDGLIKRVEKVKRTTTITSILLSVCEKLRNIRQIKDYYCKQSKYGIGDLGTEKDRVSVPIWIDGELDQSWKNNLCEAVQAINEAAPGLSLTLIEDEKGAIIHVLAIDKEEPYTEVEGNILMRSITETCDFVTKIRLGKWKDDGKKGVCIHELIHALGFHHEHQDAIADPYVYRLDSGKKITIDKNDLSFIQFDSLCTTLYSCEKKCRKHSEPHVCMWVLKAYPTQVNTERDELDMIGLNLVYPPCVNKTAVNVRYEPKLGKTGMYYCGRKVMMIPIRRTYPGEEYTHSCGPDKGPNCPACRTIKSPRVKEILDGGRWQGMTGRVYCGRPFTEPGILSEVHDGACGMNDGPACDDCYKILNKEESTYSESKV